MLRTLYGKLALTLTVLVAALLLAQILITMRVGQQYEEEFAQHTYRDLASMLLRDQIDTSWGLPVLESEFSRMMQLNPMLELYWLDLDGRLLAFSVEDDRVLLNRVDVEPIRGFLDGLPLPIRGDDPLVPDRRVIFSAAEVSREGVPSGYLYVVLQSEGHQSMGARLTRRRSARVAVGTLVLLSAFGLSGGLLLFRSITRRLSELDRDMGAFLARSGGLPPSGPQADEISRLRTTFDHLVARISERVASLEAVDRLRRELVANVSHDLRTPLAALRGYLETLQVLGEGLDEETKRHYLEAAARHTDRVAARVDELLELARLEAGAVVPRFESFRMEELVQDLVQPYALRARQAGVELRAAPSRGLPPAYADIGLIERAIENLIENALRHTPAGGSVAVELRDVEGEVEVCVRDSGRGIPPDAIAHVFDRFYRVGGTRRGEGLGLGLAIVKRVVELHGRQVEVESQPERGSRFRFRLPRDPGDAS